MAEIHIEQKERSVWPWMLVGLLALGLIVWVVTRPGVDDRMSTLAVDSAAGAVLDSSAAAGPATTDGMPAPVARFLTFVEENRARSAADSAHDYTSDGLRHLAGALDVLVRRDTVGRQSLDSQVSWLRVRADTLQRDWGSADHARAARQAFLSAASLIQALQEQRYPDAMDEVTGVVDASQGVKADLPLLQQKAEVQQFFDRVADAVRVMANTRT